MRRPPPPDPEAARVNYLWRPRVLDREGRGTSIWSEDRPWDPASFQRSLAGEAVYSNIEFGGLHLRVLSLPIRPGGEVVGVVQTARDLGELDRLRASLIRTVLTILPIALLVAVFGGVFLTDRALRPVRAVTHAAAGMSARDLSRRLPVAGHDELAELAATFNGMLERLEAAFQEIEAGSERLRRFTGDVSHELRTPLTRLKGTLDLALSRPTSAEECRESIRTAAAAANAMHRLVLDLLLVARSDAGQLRPVLRPLDLAAVLREAAAALPEPEGIELGLHLPDAPLRVWADEAQLVRLFTNLLENAVRHTPPGGRVTLAAERLGRGVLVTVRDTGEGIPPEHLPRVLERFYRVDAARDRAAGGSGLGLPIAKGIAEAHGGTLTLDSQAGLGTAVRVLLPVEPGEAPGA
jgi:heavy metal sensor kinase